MLQLLELDIDAIDERNGVYVQDEPELELAIPQVRTQPELTVLQRGKLPNVQAVTAQVYRKHVTQPNVGLGQEYQELVAEFQPLFTWAIACWDYLLSTEGCRFVPRSGEQKYGVRGDYRVVTDKDYSRMVHSLFRSCVLEFAQTPDAPSLSQWLRARFWRLIREAYRRLEDPPDPRQRTLTSYSYLRCIPYRFLNDCHQQLVYSTVKELPPLEQEAVTTYFLNFFTDVATAASLHCTPEDCTGILRQALMKLLVHNRLVYCLLRQIERY